jgi:YopX protein
MTRPIEFRVWKDYEKEMTPSYLIDQSELLYELNNWQEKIPPIPLQFTGLHDRNGKKIFEGDILKDNDCNDIGDVKWHMESAHFYIEWLGSDFLNMDDSDLKSCEIVGNIYQHPELLNKE